MKSSSFFSVVLAQLLAIAAVPVVVQDGSVAGDFPAAEDTPASRLMQKTCTMRVNHTRPIDPAVRAAYLAKAEARRRRKALRYA